MEIPMERRFPTTATLCLCGLALMTIALLPAPASAQGASESSTPPEMVATYSTLADGILALKRTEDNLVRSILAASNAHGQAQLARAKRALASSDAAGARAAVEALAAAVAQMGTEGDNAVGAVRKRLLEGGHHHNAAGEAQGVYDEGFVVVTRAAKQKLLDASRRLAQMASAPTAAGLDAEWKTVQDVYGSLASPAK
jgi:hypothetical protein